MSNSYTQNYIQFIFSTKRREKILNEKYNEELHKYIYIIAKDRKCKIYAINNVEDHMHILVSLNPTYSISKFIKELKSLASKFINEKGWYNTKFFWQEGYGAFSYSQSQVNTVIKYINNQKEHHHKKSFKEEYIEFLEKFQIEYDEKYI
ncbi:MAG: IS200/IS605 family transposase [Candidatus Delongbacteria bacterium]|nr:IS200/IS605 family transposase [Candidatus Delongbacteria bacterium]